MTTPLDSFETALLTELRTIVAARSEEPAQVPRRRRSRRWVLVPIGVAIACVAALLFLPGVGPQPAYAVSVDGTGAVHVRVHRFENATGLKSALEAQGITADVTYLADDMQCADGRYADAPEHPGDFSLSVGHGYGYRIDLAPGVIETGETLVIAASQITPTGDPDGDGTSELGGAWVSIGVAEGAVRPCVPVPARSADVGPAR